MKTGIAFFAVGPHIFERAHTQLHRERLAVCVPSLLDLTPIDLSGLVGVDVAMPEPICLWTMRPSS